jgi:hypothetical protein
MKSTILVLGMVVMRHPPVGERTFPHTVVAQTCYSIYIMTRGKI